MLSAIVNHPAPKYIFLRKIINERAGKQCFMILYAVRTVVHILLVCGNTECVPKPIWRQQSLRRIYMYTITANVTELANGLKRRLLAFSFQYTHA